MQLLGMAFALGVGKRLLDMALVEAPWVVGHTRLPGMAFALLVDKRLPDMASALASSLVVHMRLLGMAFVAFPLALALSLVVVVVVLALEVCTHRLHMVLVLFVLFSKHVVGFE